MSDLSSRSWLSIWEAERISGLPILSGGVTTPRFAEVQFTVLLFDTLFISILKQSCEENCVCVTFFNTIGKNLFIYLFIIYVGKIMTEQIQTTNINNPFASFNRNGEQNFYVTQKYIPKQEEGTDEFVSAEQNSASAPIEQPQKKRSKKKYAYAVGTSALVVGVGVLALMRGLPNGTNKFLENIKTFLENKIEKMSGSGKDTLQTFYIASLRRVNSFLEKTQSINNLTSLKDALFKKFMEQTSPTKKIHAGISGFFEKISGRTVVKAYSSTSKSFEKMNSSFAKLDEKLLASDGERIVTYQGKEYTVKELIAKAQELRRNVMSSVTEFISKKKQQERYDYIRSATDNLYEQFRRENFDGTTFKEFFSKKNRFLRKEMWQNFIADDKIAKSRQQLADDVAAVRNKLMYGNKDKINLIEKYVKEFEQTITPADKDAVELIKQLKWYMKNPEGITGQNKDAFLRILDKLKDSSFDKGISQEVLQNQITLRQGNISAITDLLNKHDSGELQQMVDIYKTVSAYNVAPLEKHIQKAINSFDKSLNLETVEFFNKVRDLRLGSAPTDVLSIVASGGMIGYGLAKAHNSDERWEVALTSGIPIIGTIGTALYCTAQLVSGSKGMLIAGASGVVLKYMGDFANYLRMKTQNKAKSTEILAR